MYSAYKGLTGSQIIYKKLFEYGVKNVSLYSGGSIMDLVDKFHHNNNNKINYIVQTHEQSVGHTATGYAKASGNMGVSIVTSGPGLTNMITPMLDSTNDSTPLLVISGQVSTNVMGTNAFQECNAVEISKPVTKFSHCIRDIESLPFVLDAAFYIANDKKKGSVHIDLPKNISTDIFTNKYNQTKNIFLDEYNEYDNQILHKYYENSNLDNTNLLEIAERINKSQKPILYIGQGCNNYSQLLTKFAKKNNIPVTTTLHAMGVFDEAEPLSLKMLGMHGSAYANYAIQESDLIICLGARFDDRTTGNISKYAPNARKKTDNKNGIIHVNINQQEINSVINSDYPVDADCGEFLEKIMDLTYFKPRVDWINQINDWKEKYPLKYNELNDGRIKTQTVLKYLNKKLANDSIITTDVGTHQMMAAQFIEWCQPKKIITSGSLGVMGTGLPYAIGAQIAYPNREVCVISGDSSFLMTLPELKTIKENNLPIKIAVINNHTQGMVKEWEKLFFKGRITATENKNNPKFHKLAESFGIKGIYCNNIDSIEDTVTEFLNYDGPILCEFDTVDEICLPLVRPGCALDEMLLEQEYIKNFNADNYEPPS